MKHCGVNDFLTQHLGEIFEALYLTDTVEEICRTKDLWKYLQWNQGEISPGIWPYNVWWYEKVIHA